MEGPILYQFRLDPFYFILYFVNDLRWPQLNPSLGPPTPNFYSTPLQPVREIKVHVDRPLIFLNVHVVAVLVEATVHVSVEVNYAGVPLVIALPRQRLPEQIGFLLVHPGVGPLVTLPQDYVHLHLKSLE